MNTYAYLVVSEEMVDGAPALLGLLLEGPEPLFHLKISITPFAHTRTHRAKGAVREKGQERAGRGFVRAGVN